MSEIFEPKKAAAALHDGPVQMVSMGALQLEAMAKKNNADPEKLEKIAEGLREAAAEMRALITQMRNAPEPGRQLAYDRTLDDRWTAVDDLLEVVVGADDGLTGAIGRSAEAGMPQIHVSAPQGKLLHLLAIAIGARSILEVGTLAGYSTIWLARAAGEGGRVITLEVDKLHAEVARTNLEAAGVANTEVVVGAAIESLQQIAARGDSFDLAFIDADKSNTASYFDFAVTVTRPGGLVIVDNVVRDGGLADSGSEDPNVKAMQSFVADLAKDQRVSATVVQTVGGKGYDGFALALVK